jgi:hypothetical protein
MLSFEEDVEDEDDLDIVPLDDPLPEDPVVFEPEVAPWFCANAGASARRPARVAKAMRLLLLFMLLPLFPMGWDGAGIERSRHAS